eukprot:3274985-Rhodomonas_salina.1
MQNPLNSRSKSATVSPAWAGTDPPMLPLPSSLLPPTRQEALLLLSFQVAFPSNSQALPPPIRALRVAESSLPPLRPECQHSSLPPSLP